MRRNCLLLLLAVAGLVRAGEPLELRDGDRLALVGATFIEREQSFGHLETFLHARWPDRGFAARNLGWSGDTVFCPARSYFGPPEEGFQRLEKNLAEWKPTVILSCYGAVEAHDGEAGLSNFLAGYERLLGMMSKTGAHIVLMSPPPLENLPAPLPNQDAQNRRVALYRSAIAQLAQKRGHEFADLFTAMGEGRNADATPRLTENGLHFTDQGYARIVPAFATSLGLSVPAASITVNAANGQAEASGASASVMRTDGSLRIEAKPESLLAASSGWRVAVRGLAPGEHVARIGDEIVLTAGAETWERGVVLVPKSDQRRLAELRQLIGQKNRQFFHRWRPQNDTYLFGFRKYEQGNNAVEIPQFDPLVAAKDRAIIEAKKAAPSVITISPKA